MYWREIAEQKMREAQRLSDEIRNMQSSLFFYAVLAIGGWGLAISLIVRGAGLGE